MGEVIEQGVCQRFFRIRSRSDIDSPPDLRRFIRMGQPSQKVSRILAVGSSSSDGVHRLTRGESFVCCAGDSREHQELSSFCLDLEQVIEASGLTLSDFSPRELEDWITAFLAGSSRV